MNYYAHSRDDQQFQLLKVHLEGVAEQSMHAAEVFGAGYLGYLVGILHDIGKYSSEFQKRIRGANIRVDHSTAGAKWIVQSEVIRKYLGETKFDHWMARLLAHIIAGHHGGLQNYGTMDEAGTLKYRLGMETIPDWSNSWREIEITERDWSNEKVDLVSRWRKEDLGWNYSFLGRMLYSCLVDADSIDTRDYCNREDLESLSMRQAISMTEMNGRFEKYMYEKLQSIQNTRINQMRQQILATCERQAETAPRLFSLTVPTGGGKTLSSLAFALRHAAAYDKRRIIYVIPFTSIIEQNAELFRTVLGNDAVLEHHSNFNQEEYEENYGADEARRLKISSENWDSPVIVTTSVQFFESLFSNKRSKLRKLHNIANSVIIIDEAQSLPRGYMKPCMKALQELIAAYGCSVVLCTATQPSWFGLGILVTEIMDTPTPSELVEVFKRVEVEVSGSDNQVTADDKIVEWMLEAEQALCIVNTRKHAKVLFEQLSERNVEGLYHLSGRLCARHRSEIIAEVSERLKNQEPCRLVSTQLIEAGVDLDFPKVLRAYAGLDSIAQAAGRCNREGRRESGRVIVFYPEKHGMPSRGWLKETVTEAQNTIKFHEGSPLSLSSIRNYFERIHGICDGRVEQVTDSKQIMKLLRSKNTNLEIPFEDIAEDFMFIDGQMKAIVVPYDSHALQLIEQLRTNPYPLQVMRQLQPYTVQIYQHEYREFLNKQLLMNVEGVLLLLENGYYHSQTGLLAATEEPEMDVLLF
ncbi:CRISPR-associated helicase Cas3' [Brevibacillus sp. 179-C9.3 HS]|uniref:CRISPR-associated helicase Cas3' n=1 Tax=unclassified Brevibacillus TaxID=2684853 RepID=UPI0039A15471